ncbi:hypothetical protein WA026_018742 [Henosepilachna vigintioctopunctata]|uniref:Uncharacterized protein n=1 Tax=Henosepilachna vigintioctopunctata TaxID=420089 RepID=A0AAW1TM84_9CUCU
MSSKNMLSTATRYIAGRNAVQTVYWRADQKSQQPKMLKVSKTFNLGKGRDTYTPPQHIKDEKKIKFV